MYVTHYLACVEVARTGRVALIASRSCKMNELEQIAEEKWPDLTAADMDAAVRTIAGSARSAGIDVEGVN